ncbi:hypothetical protein ACFQMF_14865 [Halorubrum rutilum]|uniref:DUF4352 domain-containing protein n=1 Tax=Halorubrum rutilum TaxID=1364933 RepID=A0ABD6APF2_9EURY|nr:hypothetical protein [Halorubrum rutilum]
MTRPPSRRRFLAAAVPIALAGCLVEDGSNAADQTGETAGGDQSGETAPAADDESTASEATDGSDDAEPTADAADGDGDASPGPAGVTVEETEIVRIVESNLLSQIVADVTVRNTGEQAYGTLELRVDAYYEPPEDDRTYHPPRVDERTAVGRTYVEGDFESFDSGTRTFEDVVVRYDAEDANDSTDPAEFDLEIAVRRANPP